MRRFAVTMSAMFLTACGSQPGPTAEASASTARPTETVAADATPDLAACPKPDTPVAPDTRLRTEAIAVPAALRGVMRADMESFAVSTLGGGTVCVDASWMEALDNARLSADGRFASFDWFGYEAFGHVIVDRDGKGYTYDHDTAEGFSGDNYWPEEMEPQAFYQPVERGFERQVKERLEWWDRKRRELRGQGE